MSDKELIIRLKNGDFHAFDRIYDRYWRRVYHFCSLYLNSRPQIEEAVQDVFVKLWEARRSIREEENIDGYLFIICRNHIFNIYRKRPYILTGYDNSAHLTYGTCDTEENIEARNLGEYVNSLVDRMPLQRRTVYIMSRRDMLPYKEITLKLNVSEKTVERHINEALKFLKKHLK